MKANAPKRKVFADAMDFLTDGAVIPENDVQMIPVDEIKPFRNHPFRLYEGERLDDMVESIKVHGILMPVIVWQTEDGYEMIAGHNRQNAARLAGLDKIPAIVKKDITEAEAYVYVIETNVVQRSFSELLPSEKGEVLTERYEKVICQGKRNDILQEIARLEGKEVSCGHDVHKSRSRDGIGEEYGMTGRNIARYMRVDKLIRPFKDRLDAGELTLTAAVELSYLPENEQTIVAEKDAAINEKTAKSIRAVAGELTEDELEEILHPVRESTPAKAVSIKIPAKVYGRYFSNVAAKDVQSILEAALDLYFERKGA